MTSRELEGFFAPRSVAVIGASESSGWTRTLLAGWEASSAPPEIFLVNPTRDMVCGRSVVRSILDIGRPVDLGFVLVGPERVLPAVREGLEHGIRDFVLLSSGLAESGDEGKLLEAELVELCRREGARLLGPNVSGFVNLADGVNLFGLAFPPNVMSGSVAFVMQSGGLATHALSLASQWGLGVSRLVTTGNEASMTLSDVLDDLVDDPNTKVVALFIETVRDVPRFRAAARRAHAAGKPVIALHVGSSDLGRSSALAHTGALLGDHATAVAALESLGVVCVSTMEELVASAGLLAMYPQGLRGRRIAAIAASGGACELVADESHELGIELPAFDHESLAELSSLVPEGGTFKNPLDMTGLVVKHPSLTFEAVEALASTADGLFDAVLFQAVLLPTAETVRNAEVVERFARLGRLAKGSNVPVLLQTAATYSLDRPSAELVAAEGLFVLPGIHVGMRAVLAAMRSAQLRDGLSGRKDLTWTALTPERSDLEAALTAAGFPRPPQELAADPRAAGAAADRIGYPVVLKVESAEIAHKSDVGGVSLNLGTREEVEAAAARMLETVAAHLPAARIDGFLVARMRPAGTELLVSVVQDDAWGPMLTLGAGGVLTELLDDVVIRPLPMRPEEVKSMLGELRLARLLDGYRGAPPADLDVVATAIQSVVRVAHCLGDSARAVEVNPLWVLGDQAEALDLLVEWR